MEIKGEMLRKVIQQFREEKRKTESMLVILQLCFINATPCVPVSESEGLVRL